MNCYFHPATPATIPTRTGRDRLYVCTLGELRRYHALYVPREISDREFPKIQARTWQRSENEDSIPDDAPEANE